MVAGCQGVCQQGVCQQGVCQDDSYESNMDNLDISACAFQYFRRSMGKVRRPSPRIMFGEKIDALCRVASCYAGEPMMPRHSRRCAQGAVQHGD